MRRLRELLPITGDDHSEHGIDPDAKEAIAFAILAMNSFNGARESSVRDGRAARCASRQELAVS